MSGRRTTKPATCRRQPKTVNMKTDIRQPETMTEAPTRGTLAALTGSGYGEKQIKLAAKLYAARDSMRGFWRENYKSKVEENQGFIRAGMAKYNCDELHATMKMVAVLQEKYPDSGMTQALLLAAYVETIEPSIQNDGLEPSARSKGKNLCKPTTSRTH